MGTEKEQKVLNAAWSVFMKYGYKRVTMGDIAEAAGISRPALYLIYNKKEDVFRAVVRHNGNQRLEVNELSKDGARCRFRTCDPYRVKVMLYH